MSVFSPLKHALAAETDGVTRFDPSRIYRVECNQMFILSKRESFYCCGHREWMAGYQARAFEPNYVARQAPPGNDL
jgi:hypothetical protein